MSWSWLAVAVPLLAGCLDLEDLPALPTTAPSSVRMAVRVSPSDNAAGRVVWTSVEVDPGRINDGIRALLDSALHIQGTPNAFKWGGEENPRWLAGGGEEFQGDTVVIGVPGLEEIPALRLHSVLPVGAIAETVEPDSLGVLRFPMRVPTPELIRHDAGMDGVGLVGVGLDDAGLDGVGMDDAGLAGFGLASVGTAAAEFQTANWSLRIKSDLGGGTVVLSGSGAPPPVLEVLASLLGAGSSPGVGDDSPEEFTGELSVSATFTADFGSGTSRQLVVMVLREDVVVRIQI